MKCQRYLKVISYLKNQIKEYLCLYYYFLNTSLNQMVVFQIVLRQFKSDVNQIQVYNNSMKCYVLPPKNMENIIQ